MKTVAIIGMGARGLGVLERITAIYQQKDHAGTALEIHLIDPGEYGQGTHSLEQRHHLLTNTVCCQITMFPDPSITGAGPIRKGPSLLDWARAEGYRHSGNTYYKSADQSGDEIQPNDYLPRALLGEYLTWVYDHLVGTLPRGIQLRRHKRIAIDLRDCSDNTMLVTLDNGYQFSADYVFLTTGHGHNLPNTVDNQFYQFVQKYSACNPHLQYCRTPYALRQLVSISSEAVVAIQGLGLSAHDVIAEFTAGRGGRFVTEEGALRYIPSGREPRLLVFSRNSIPFSGRAVNQKGTDGQYQAKFFTREAIRSLRSIAQAERGTWQLDFEQDVWPLMIKEMAYVHRATREEYWPDPNEFEVSNEDREALEQILFPMPHAALGDLSQFKKFITQHLRSDMEQAEEGNLQNPVKAATDMFRDVRSTLRYAVDFKGLTPQSHEQFLDEYCPIIGRVAIGPPKERNMELLALMEAGVVDWAGGPNPTVVCDQQTGKFVIETKFRDKAERQFADVLIKARIEPFILESDDSLLVRNLQRRGLVRPFSNGEFHPGGIDISRDQNPIDNLGSVVPNIWALGNIVEGPNFYTYVLPQPCVNSSVIRDAARCVSSMFSQFSYQAPADRESSADEASDGA